MAELGLMPLPAHQQLPMTMRYPTNNLYPPQTPLPELGPPLKHLNPFPLITPWLKHMYNAQNYQNYYNALPVSVGVVFTQEELNMSLYGYLKEKEGEAAAGHAVSGLKTVDLNHGIEKILSPKSSLQTRDRSPAPLNRSTLNLPDGLKLISTSCAGSDHVGVFCDKPLSKGHRFGPFTGKVVHTSEMKSNDDNSYMWEIFESGHLSHFIDGRGPSGNWMSHVNCARYTDEQNLIAVQAEGQIYYEACKDIRKGTELLVWYGDTYVQFMGIPVALRDTIGVIAAPLDEAEGYLCERCGKVFAYKYYRDKHLKYTRCVDQGDRKFPCHLCTRSFEKRDRLRIHILHVHEKHRPHCCNVCGKSFSQSSSLNKHMRVHSGERPYKCVYCSKAFTASSILRTHIRQHSGEKPFKCKHCGKAFASHAAHDSHMRRTHAKERDLSKSGLSDYSKAGLNDYSKNGLTGITDYSKSGLTGIADYSKSGLTELSCGGGAALGAVDVGLGAANTGLRASNAGLGASNAGMSTGLSTMLGERSIQETYSFFRTGMMLPTA